MRTLAKCFRSEIATAWSQDAVRFLRITRPACFYDCKLIEPIVSSSVSVSSDGMGSGRFLLHGVD